MDLIIMLLLITMPVVYYKIQNSFFRFLSFLSLFFLVYMIMWLILDDLMVAAALIIGLTALLNSLIFKYFFPPIFEHKIKKGPEIVNKSGKLEKWWHLYIKNNGFSPAKNLKVKIKDDRDGSSWIHLTLPYTTKNGTKNYIIKNFSPSEDYCFDIGHYIKEKNEFKLESNISPRNQKITIKENENQDYYLEIISDNSQQKRIRINIENNNGKIIIKET